MKKELLIKAEEIAQAHSSVNGGVAVHLNHWLRYVAVLLLLEISTTAWYDEKRNLLLDK